MMNLRLPGFAAASRGAGGRRGWPLGAVRLGGATPGFFRDVSPQLVRSCALTSGAPHPAPFQIHRG